MPEHFQMRYFLSCVDWCSPDFRTLILYEDKAPSPGWHRLCLAQVTWDLSWFVATKLPALDGARRWTFNTCLLQQCLTFLGPFPWGNNYGNDTLEANVGKYLWITPQKFLFLAIRLFRAILSQKTKQQHTTAQLQQLQTGVTSGTQSRWVCKAMHRLNKACKNHPFSTQRNSLSGHRQFLNKEELACINHCLFAQRWLSGEL